MNITNIIIKSENNIQININKTKSIPISLINGLRRIMISEIPTLAIDKAQFRNYNSMFPDEYFAHRLGLIPIKRKNKYISEGKIQLNIQFDPNKSNFNGIQTIYSDSLISFDPNIEIVDKNIILTKLIKGNEIDIICDVVLGTGLIHAKWNPCSGTSYEYDDNEYKFYIETIGTINSYELFIDSIEIYIEKLENLLNLF